MGRAWMFVYFALLTFSMTICVKTTTTKAPELEPSREASGSDDKSLPFETFLEECNETFRTDMAYIDALNSSGSFPDETDRTSKCFVRCVLEKSDVVSEAGVFYPPQAMLFFATERAGTPEEDFRDSTQACSNRNETCMCDRSYQFVKCVMKMKLSEDMLE